MELGGKMAMGRIGYEDDRCEAMGLLASHFGGALESLWVHFRITLDLLSAVNNFCEGRLAWNLLLVGVFNAYSRHFFDATSRMTL